LWRSVRRLGRQTLAECLALRAQFGDVVRLPLVPHPVYVLSHPDAVQYVLRSHASNFRKGILFRQIAALQGEGLLTSEGVLWHRQRRLVQPAFRPAHLSQLGNVLTEEIQALLQSWQQAARTGVPVNVSAWMHRLTFRMVGRALLGVAPEALDQLGWQLQAIGKQLFPSLAARLTRTWALPAWFPSAGRCRFRRAVAAYHHLAQQVIAARRLAMPQHHTPPTDLLATLIAAHDNTTAEGPTEPQLRDEVITFIGAGVETAAQALSWTWYLLACAPESTRRLQAELAAVLGTRHPTPDDIARLPYCRMVLDEALRLYPPAAVLPRQANSHDAIGGYAIPKNAVLLLSPFVTHRHPEFWPEPERFCPGRFAPDRVAARHRYAYFPFGAGPRQCIGQPLAHLEMTLALAAIAQAYTLRLIPERAVIPHLSTTLQPRGGLWMTVHARSPFPTEP
jgi:cytochrome P450